MIQIISGEKGKGKTKELLAKVNNAVKSTNGTIVYLDKNPKHMYELSTRARLVNVKDFLISNCDEFIGFISGIISQDNDLEEMYLDSFLTLGNVHDDEIFDAIEKLDSISNKHDVNIVISLSKNEEDLPNEIKDKIIISL